LINSIKKKAYGKYNYLDKIFSKEILMTAKPLLLRDYLSKALYSRLSRYRRKNNSPFEKSTAAVE